MLPEPKHQFLWYGAAEGLVCRRRVVACLRNHSYLVLHLHHDYRVKIAIFLLDVSHERGEGMRIGLLVLLRKWRKPFRSSAVRGLHSGEPVDISFYPLRRVARIGVLPASKPKKHKPKMILPGAIDQPVDDAEVKLPVLGFHQLP